MTLGRTTAAVLILSGFTGVCAPAPAPPPPAPVSSASASDWERVVTGIPVTDEAGDPVDHPFLAASTSLAPSSPMRMATAIWTSSSRSGRTG